MSRILQLAALVCALLGYNTGAARTSHSSPVLGAVKDSAGTDTSITLNRDEFSILRDLYQSLGGDSWVWETGDYLLGTSWNFLDGTDPCVNRWQGVFCTSECNDTCHVYSLNLTAHNLHGQLPATFFNLSQLEFLYLSDNVIHGPLPEIVNLPALSLFNLSYNSLTGLIPDSIGKMHSLNLLYLSNNRLSGPIPPCFTKLAHLQYLYLLNNDLSGPLPAAFGNLTELLFFNLGSNRVSGEVPASFIGLKKLQLLYLNNNSFSGPFPRGLPASLTKMSLECNQFSGPLPLFEHLRNLTVLKLNDNHFTGPLPALQRLQSLQILQLHQNHFTGSADIFDPLLQLALTNVDISNNALSGWFPEAVFLLPMLGTLAAVKNCFSGTLPSTLCQARSLSVLSLDGLTASSDCVDFLWDPLQLKLTAGYIAKSMSGEIPDCVWSLPNLTSLHLSGNAFTGPLVNSVGSSSSSGISDGFSISPSLIDVSLSHNRLSGSIPSMILTHPFQNLDLSYNRLTGSIYRLQNSLLNTSQSTGVALKLQENRLSGALSDTLYDAYGVDVLYGNVFSCSDADPLPQHDPQSRNYICGSDELDRAMLSFAALLGLLVVVMSGVAVWRYQRYQSKQSHQNQQSHHQSEALHLYWERLLYVYRYSAAIGVQLDAAAPVTHLTHPALASFPAVVRFNSSLVLLRQMFVLVAAYSVLVCMPVYLAFYLYTDSSGAPYSTHTNRYSWITTTVFLTGQVPAITIFALWMAAAVMLVLRVLWEYRLLNKTPLSRLSSLLKRDSLSFFRPSGYTDPLSLSLSEEGEGEDRGLDRDSLATVAYSEGSYTPPCPPPTPYTPPRSPTPYTPRPSRLESADLDMRESDATLLCQRAPPTPNTSSVTTRASEIYTHTKRAARGGARWWQEAAVFALNAAATIAVNIIYVSYESSTHTSASSKVLIQVLMAGFKVVWNSVVVRQLCQLIHDRNIRSHVLMLIFNTLVAPCLASAVFDKSCFSDLIFGSDTMCTQYSYPSCLEAYQQYSSTMGQIETVCTHYINTAYVTEYTPSFIYSFACGSALLKAYIPVYIYSYTMLALLLPLFFFLLCATPLQHIPPCLLPHILGVMRPRQVADGVRFNQLLKAQSMQALYIQHLVVLLTFGVASPALAAVIALAVVVDSYALQGVLVRFVECASPNSVFCNADTDTDTDRDPSPHASPHARHAFGYAAPCGDWSAHSPSRPGEVAAGGAFEQARLGELEEACGDTWSSLRHTVWLVFYCCTTFYAALLFDVIGDNSGLQAALAVPVTALVVLLLVRLCAAPLLTELHEMHKSGKSNWFQIITRYTHNAQNWDWDIMCASLCCERKRGSGSRGSDKGSRGSSDLGEEASFLNADSDEAPPGTPGDSNGANSNSPLLYRSPHPPHSPHN